MKKIVMILMVGVAILLTSCNKDLDLDIKFQLTVNIENIDVVKNLKDIDNSDLFPNGVIDADDAKVRVTLLCYNSDGKLCFEESQLVEDFSKSIEIAKSVESGNYTLVTITDIVGIENGKVSTELWQIENKETLRDLKVTKGSTNLFYYMALGISKESLTVDGSMAVNVNTEPIGSLVTFKFTNIDQSKVSLIGYGWSKESDYCLINEGTYNIVAQTSVEEFEMESQYTTYYDQRYFLPIQDMTFVWISYSPSLTPVLSKGMTLNIQSGVNKTITVNVNSGVSTETNSTKSAFIPNSDGQVLRIQSLPTKKINSVQ